MPAHNPSELPANLPIPQDDGAADHLGREPFNGFPAWLELDCTDGSTINLAQQNTLPTVLFFYPRTGIPGQPPNLGFDGEDWDSIAGARGCTPQSCGFRDLYAEFESHGITVFGISTNTTEHQLEFKQRQRIPFEFLSDSELRLTRAMALPTFEFPVESGGPTTLIRRMAMFCDYCSIIKVWYPVFPPDRSARTVLDWIRTDDERTKRLLPLRETLQRETDQFRREQVFGWSKNRIGSSAANRDFTIRPINPRDLTFVREELTRNFHATQISSRGRWFDADQLPGFIATRRDGLDRIGLLTHTAPAAGEACEVVTLSSRLENSGVGSQLLAAAVEAARSARCSRIFLTTTNDNLRAIGFYQRRGWTLAALHPRQMDIARQTKPEIPLMGANGIPLRDELELEIRFLPPEGRA